MIEDRLIPCPFCGSEPLCLEMGGWEVFCKTCGASGPTFILGTKNETTSRADAILTWNTRANTGGKNDKNS